MTEQGYIQVPRDQWGAKFSPGRKDMTRGLRDVFLHHTVTAATNDPCGDMRRVERVLNDRGLAPGYSYTIHPSGVVLVGAGLKVGAHTEGHNSRGFGLSFIGDFNTATPTLAALVAAARTVNLLRLSGYLVPELDDIRIRLHRDMKPTACPGANLVNVGGTNKSASDWVRWFAGTGA